MGNSNCDQCGHDTSMCECGVKQVGGEHYKAEKNYQHWDWCIDIRLGYLEAAATKYITRWRGKNGVQDVDKGISYLQKAREAYRQGKLKNRSTLVGANTALADLARGQTMDFCRYNKLGSVEAAFMHKVGGWQYEADLRSALVMADKIRQQAIQHQAAQSQPSPHKPAQTASDASSGGVGGTTTQPPTTSTSTEVASKSVEGQEHPFGYDEWDEWSEGDIG